MKLLSSMLFFHLEVGDTFETRVTMLLVNLLWINGTYFKTYYIMCSLADVGVLRDIQPQCSTGTWHDVGLKLLVNWRTYLCLATWDYVSWDYHDSTNRSTCGSRQEIQEIQEIWRSSIKKSKFPWESWPLLWKHQTPLVLTPHEIPGILRAVWICYGQFNGTSDYQIFGLSKQMKYPPYKTPPYSQGCLTKKMPPHLFWLYSFIISKKHPAQDVSTCFCSTTTFHPQIIPQTLPIQSAIHPNGGVPCGDRPVEWAYGPCHCIARKLNGTASDAGCGKSLANRNWDLDTAGNSFFRNG